VQIEIQIVDTHETLETPVVIGLQAFEYQKNWTLLFPNIFKEWNNGKPHGYWKQNGEPH
jgi:hypothetical protein